MVLCLLCNFSVNLNCIPNVKRSNVIESFISAPLSFNRSWCDSRLPSSHRKEILLLAQHGAHFLLLRQDFYFSASLTLQFPAFIMEGSVSLVLHLWSLTGACFLGL